MGRIKDWNVLLDWVFTDENFEAVMLDVPYEEKLGGLPEEVFAKWQRTPGAVKMAEDREKADINEMNALIEEQVFKAIESYAGCEEKLYSDMAEAFENVQQNYSFEADIGYALEENAPVIWSALESRTQAVWSLPKTDIRADEAELSEESGMRLTREKTDRMLDCVLRADEGIQKQEIRIETVSSAKSDGADVDDMLDEMTARLCAMMAKGTDGIYM